MTRPEQPLLSGVWDLGSGASGPMRVCELEQILTETGIDPCYHWLYSGWGEKAGLSKGIATLLFGPEYLPEMMLESPMEARLSLNIAVPVIPEFRVMKLLYAGGSHRGLAKKEYRNIECVGWREVLRDLVGNRKISGDSGLLRFWLGAHDYEDLQRQLRGFPAYGKVKTVFDKRFVASHDRALRPRAKALALKEGLL